MKTLEQHWLELANSQDKSDPCWHEHYQFPRAKPTVWASEWEYGITQKHHRPIYTGKRRSVVL